MSSPLVNVVMITYNHEEFIEKSINSILMQECEFEFDLLIADDKSTDNTESIIRRIIAEHPQGQKIKYIRHEKNIGMTPNFIFAITTSNAKYIALCEGDDYWRGTDKLQKQVRFLENNPDHILTAGGFVSVDKNGETEIIQQNPHKNTETQKGFSFTVDDFLKKWLVKTLTLVFRNDKDAVEKFSKYKYARDMHLCYHLLLNGKGYYHTEPLGIYNVHQGGVVSMKSRSNLLTLRYNIYKEFNELNNNRFSQKKHLTSAVKKLKNSFRIKDEPGSFLNKRILLRDITRNIKSVDDIITITKLLVKG